MTEQYFMRTTDAQGRAHGGFQWPMEVGAIVTAPDWNPKPVCGGGLHGLLNGGGDASHLSFGTDAATPRRAEAARRNASQPRRADGGLDMPSLRMGK